MGVLVTALGGGADVGRFHHSVSGVQPPRFIFKKWFFSEGIGLLLMVPLVLAWANTVRRRLPIPDWPALIEPALCLLTTPVCCAVCVRGRLAAGNFGTGAPVLAGPILHVGGTPASTPHGDARYGVDRALCWCLMRGKDTARL